MYKAYLEFPEGWGGVLFGYFQELHILFSSNKIVSSLMNFPQQVLDLMLILSTCLSVTMAVALV